MTKIEQSTTPMPWAQDGHEIVYPGAGEGDHALVAICVQHNGDTALICRAVNSHAVLVEALEEVIALVVDDPPGGLQILPGDVAQSVRAALTLAKGA